MSKYNLTTAPIYVIAENEYAYDKSDSKPKASCTWVHMGVNNATAKGISGCLCMYLHGANRGIKKCPKPAFGAQVASAFNVHKHTHAHTFIP